MIRVTIVLTDDPRKPYHPGQQRTLRGSRIHVTGVQAITLGDVTRSDARALGHTERRGQKDAVDVFRRAWLADHDTPWLAREERSELEQRARFERRWAWREAVLVSYIAVEAPRLMARGAGDGHGYTATRAMSIDPDAECVDKATQEHISAKARVKNAALQATFQDDLEAARAAKKAERRPWAQAS